MPSYYIKDIHALFEAEYPLIERAAPTSGPEVLGLAGMPPILTDGASRWWFKSQDDSMLLQLQENFIACNWRRRPEGTPYIGFEALQSEFSEAVSKLKGWHQSHGGDLPSPLACELLYDDLIEISPGGGDISRLSDILSFWSSSQSPFFGWNINWYETIPGENGEEGIMKFSAQAADLPEQDGSGRIRPIVRLNFVAMAMTPTMDAVGSFLDAAHIYIRKRFVDLIRPEAMAAWGEMK